MLSAVVQRARPPSNYPRNSAVVAKLLPQLLGLLEARQRQFAVCPDRCGVAGLLEEQRAFLVAVGDLERLVEVGHSLHRGPEGDGPIGGGPQRDPRLARERLGLGAVGRGPVRRQVVGCQRAGELVIAKRFEMARRGEVPAAPVAQARGSSRRPRG